MHLLYGHSSTESEPYPEEDGNAGDLLLGYCSQLCGRTILGVKGGGGGVCC